MGMNCVFRDRAGVWPLRAFDIVALWLPVLRRSNVEAAIGHCAVLWGWDLMHVARAWRAALAALSACAMPQFMNAHRRCEVAVSAGCSPGKACRGSRTQRTAPTICGGPWSAARVMATTGWAAAASRPALLGLQCPVRQYWSWSL